MEGGASFETDGENKLDKRDAEDFGLSCLPGCRRAGFNFVPAVTSRKFDVENEKRVWSGTILGV